MTRIFDFLMKIFKIYLAKKNLSLNLMTDRLITDQGDDIIITSDQ